MLHAKLSSKLFIYYTKQPIITSFIFHKSLAFDKAVVISRHIMMWELAKNGFHGLFIDMRHIQLAQGVAVIHGHILESLND